ncbi:MAG: mucoidy inhibitor MuiA family protein [Flavobacteriales bacterium]|nr:mucoidy inhibitor MuiA family protein [Flavobacteriales bacterium]
MKTSIACIGFIFISTCIFGESVTKLNSKINKVTVFLNGAQITREADFSFSKGVSEFVFDSLSYGINNNSIQVSGKGKFIILDTKYRVVQPDYSNPNAHLPAQIIKQLQQLNDSIENVTYDIEESNSTKQMLETEKQFLITNKTMITDSLPVLKDALTYFREKYNDINNRLLQNKKYNDKLQKRMKGLNERLQKLNQEIANKYGNRNQRELHQIAVTILADAASIGKLSLNYTDNNASWTPSYDLRSSQINEPVELTYKASIVQNTGENWDNVKIKLSTNNPFTSKIKPVLPTWYVNYYQPYSNKKTESTGMVFQPSSTMDMDKRQMKEKVSLSEAEDAGYYTTMTENFTSVEFDIAIPYSIPSDGETHTVVVKEEKMNVDYRYFIVPKVDQNAFLVASIKGFENLNLLPAAANIYFGGTYIGQTMINPKVTGDSLSIDFGKEERISAQRIALKIDEKESFLGGDRIKNYGFEITVRNNFLSTVQLTVEDQIPVSNHKDITVSLKSKEHTSFNENNGMLVWKLSLAQKETKKLAFKYEMKYPKDSQIYF